MKYLWGLQRRVWKKLECQCVSMLFVVLVYFKKKREIIGKEFVGLKEEIKSFGVQEFGCFWRLMG